MGKPSQLKSGSRDWEPRGNQRQLVDLDGCPAGCDPDIWHLAVYFEDKAGQNGIILAARKPVLYEYMKKGLTNLPPPDIRARARNCGIQVTWVLIVEKAIDYYYGTTTTTSIENFTTTTILDYYIKTTIDILQREELLRTGTRVPQPEREIKPSKRTEEQKIAAKILLSKPTEEEMLEKMREFRNRKK